MEQQQVKAGQGKQVMKSWILECQDTTPATNIPPGHSPTQRRMQRPLMLLQMRVSLAMTNP